MTTRAAKATLSLPVAPRHPGCTGGKPCRRQPRRVSCPRAASRRSEQICGPPDASVRPECVPVLQSFGPARPMPGAQGGMRLFLRDCLAPRTGRSGGSFRAPVHRSFPPVSPIVTGRISCRDPENPAPALRRRRSRRSLSPIVMVPVVPPWPHIGRQPSRGRDRAWPAEFAVAVAVHDAHESHANRGFQVAIAVEARSLGSFCRFTRLATARADPIAPDPKRSCGRPPAGGPPPGARSLSVSAPALQLAGVTTCRDLPPSVRAVPRTGRDSPARTCRNARTPSWLSPW